MINDDRFRPELRDILRATSLLSRLPLPHATERAAEAAWAWPLVGLLHGAIAAALAALLLALGLPAPLSAGVTLAVLVAMSGALHEDGLADCVDGFWGGWERARRLEIMKDSHIGAYGVIALVLSLLLRWGALSALFAGGWIVAPLLAAGALSRAPMAVLMSRLQNARGEGLSRHVGRPGRNTAHAAVLLALLLALLLLGPWSAAVTAALVALSAFGCARIAQAKIGGQTGDVLGATQQISEIAALLALTTLL
ncbi:adenosylcobinamide-GDP ribazoletransferase [Candidatus Halocynthiibacter alkanivorans]|uniref:adenosylcobinamide-GDP ribazoletransferase n=1 Tax=Candidatus Halocynthiibacter alkanivorans TaxID=2267619 RepID=UPI000DF4508B|nr:adenosylcobinamide-GDP ribazoletransferase [Candidatus Halocynthiibacter alkanivorans]